MSFLRAIFGGRLAEGHPEIARRLKICRDCEKSAVKKDGAVYCSECRCPQTKLWPVSELHYKVGYARVRCPLGRWGDQQRDLSKSIPDSAVRESMRPLRPHVTMPNGVETNGR